MGNLSEKEARISELEPHVAELRHLQSAGARAAPGNGGDESLEAKVERVEEWVAAMHDDTRDEHRLDRLEGLMNNKNPAGLKKQAVNVKERKPRLEHKVVQNIAQLGPGVS